MMNTAAILQEERRDWFPSILAVWTLCLKMVELETKKVAILEIILLKCTLCCMLSMQGSHKNHVT